MRGGSYVGQFPPVNMKHVPVEKPWKVIVILYQRAKARFKFGLHALFVKRCVDIAIYIDMI